MSVKYGTGYGVVVAETMDEAVALHDFITNYREPKPQEPVTVLDMLAATIDMMAEDPHIDYSDEIAMLSNIYQDIDDYLSKYVCPTCGKPYDDNDDDEPCNEMDNSDLETFFNFMLSL